MFDDCSVSLFDLFGFSIFYVFDVFLCVVASYFLYTNAHARELRHRAYTVEFWLIFAEFSGSL